jgi:phosphoribosylamine--glycine ligase
MGTITDSGLLTSAQTQQIVNDIIEPTLQGCLSEGFPFRGILFLGLMMTTGGPKVLEYNVRFGDPETQSILVRLETELMEICEAMLDGRLSQLTIDWRPGNSACVVLAAEGYPQRPRTGDVIVGLDEAKGLAGVTVFHAGTRISEAGIVTAGGRVLSVTATGENLGGALDSAYRAVELISWPGMQFRRDIGRTV